MMAGTRPRRCKRSQAWNRECGRQHLEAQAESGLSVHDYCFAYGLEVHTFYNWRRRLNRERPIQHARTMHRACPRNWCLRKWFLSHRSPCLLSPFSRWCCETGVGFRWVRISMKERSDGWWGYWSRCHVEPAAVSARVRVSVAGGHAAVV